MMIWGNDHILGIYRLYWGTLVPEDDFWKMTIYIYRLYRGTLVLDDDFGKMVPDDDFGKIYLVFIGCIGVLWYLIMILGK